MHYLRQCSDGRGVPLHPHAPAAVLPALNRRRRDRAVAIYSLHVKTVSRSAGRSVVAAAAYRAAENIGDDRLGVVWDFTRKCGVLHSEIMAPAGAPEWARDRAELWNAAERAEDKSTRRSSATTGRDIILALPHELSDEQRIDAVREFAAALVERYGVAVDFAIHAPDRHSDERNYHAHLLMTTRRIGAGRVRREDPRARRFQNRAARDRSDPARVGTNRQSGARTSRARHPHRLPQLCRPGPRPRGDGASGPGRFGHGAQAARRPISATATGRRRRAMPSANGSRATGRRCRPRSSISRPSGSGGTRSANCARAIRTHSPPRILEVLTERRSTFSRGDLNRELAKVIPDPKAAGGADRSRFWRCRRWSGSRRPRRRRCRATRRGRCSPAKPGSSRTPRRLPARAGYGLTTAQGEAALDRHPQVTGERRAAFWQRPKRAGWRSSPASREPAKARPWRRCATPMRAPATGSSAWPGPTGRAEPAARRLSQRDDDRRRAQAARNRRQPMGRPHGADRRRGGDAVDQAPGRGHRPGAGRRAPS